MRESFAAQQPRGLLFHTPCDPLTLTQARSERRAMALLLIRPTDNASKNLRIAHKWGWFTLFITGETPQEQNNIARRCDADCFVLASVPVYPANF